jgi:glyoxylate/hydroxypyruvate reductase A
MTPIAVAYITAAQGGGDSERWTRMLGEALGRPVDMRVWPNIGRAEDVTVALAWKAPGGALARFPNLRLIVSLGMGVDHLLLDAKLPADIPIVRIMDEGLIGQMSEYAIYYALRHHRAIPAYEASQRARQWKVEDFVDTADRRIGIMGLGAIGTDVARKFLGLGFPTSGWSRTPRNLVGIACHHGAAGLDAFLAGTDILVDVLPLTPETTGMIDGRLLGKLPKGAYFINMARGGHVVDADLLAALDSGHLSGATLDVFNEEPLPGSHPYWTHPKVLVTPHIAGETNPRTAAASVADNIRRLEAGQPLIHTIDRAAGY